MRNIQKLNYEESSNSSDFTGGERDSDFQFQDEASSSSSVEFVDIQHKFVTTKAPADEEFQEEALCIRSGDKEEALCIRSGFKIKYSDAPFTFNVYSPDKDECFITKQSSNIDDIKWYDKDQQFIQFLNANTVVDATTDLSVLEYIKFFKQATISGNNPKMIVNRSGIYALFVGPRLQLLNLFQSSNRIRMDSFFGVLQYIVDQKLDIWGICRIHII